VGADDGEDLAAKGDAAAGKSWIAADQDMAPSIWQPADASFTCHDSPGWYWAKDPPLEHYPPLYSGKLRTPGNTSDGAAGDDSPRRAAARYGQEQAWRYCRQF
jgi:hypothetical protein